MTLRGYKGKSNFIIFVHHYVRCLCVKLKSSHDLDNDTQYFLPLDTFITVDFNMIFTPPYCIYDFAKAHLKQCLYL